MNSKDIDPAEEFIERFKASGQKLRPLMGTDIDEIEIDTGGLTAVVPEAD